MASGTATCSGSELGDELGQRRERLGKKENRGKDGHTIAG